MCCTGEEISVPSPHLTSRRFKQRVWLESFLIELNDPGVGFPSGSNDES